MTKRVEYVDIAKAAAIFLVVLGEDARVGAIEKRALKDMFECCRRNILADGVAAT